MNLGLGEEQVVREMECFYDYLISTWEYIFHWDIYLPACKMTAFVELYKDIMSKHQNNGNRDLIAF